MTWLQTASGRAFDLLDPRPEDVDFREICNALGQINRFTGHCTRPVSVALHTLTVARLTSYHALRSTRLHRAMSGTFAGHALAWAVLHDAHEAYLGDISSPLKRALPAFAAKAHGADGARMVEHVLFGLASGIDDAILAASGLRWRMPGYPDADAVTEVKRADAIALMMERRDFMAPSKRPWADDLEDLDLPRWRIDWKPGPEAAEDLYRLMTNILPALFPGHKR